MASPGPSADSCQSHSQLWALEERCLHHWRGCTNKNSGNDGETTRLRYTRISLFKSAHIPCRIISSCPRTIAVIRSFRPKRTDAFSFHLRSREGVGLRRGEISLRPASALRDISHPHVRRLRSVRSLRLGRKAYARRNPTFQSP